MGSTTGRVKSIGICCFSAKHTALRRKNKIKVWLWIMIICRGGATCLPADCCLSELALKHPTKRIRLVESGYHHLFECNLFSPWYSWKIVRFGIKQLSLTQYAILLSWINLLRYSKTTLPTYQHVYCGLDSINKGDHKSSHVYIRYGLFCA
jgi:hypothetical protein